jgi:hypothetical protein
MGIHHLKEITRNLLNAMTIRQLTSRLEVNFWQILIGLLSESQPIRKSIRWLCLALFPVLADYYSQINRKLLLRWAAAGLGLGLLTGFLISLI